MVKCADLVIVNLNENAELQLHCREKCCYYSKVNCADASHLEDEYTDVNTIKCGYDYLQLRTFFLFPSELHKWTL